MSAFFTFMSRVKNQPPTQNLGKKPPKITLNFLKRRRIVLILELFKNFQLSQKYLIKTPKPIRVVILKKK